MIFPTNMNRADPTLLSKWSHVKSVLTYNQKRVILEEFFVVLEEY
jgi:hypothetical protein